MSASPPRPRRFVPAFINIALVPDSGASYFLSRILGPARALEWMASGRMVDADEALDVGPGVRAG